MRAFLPLVLFLASSLIAGAETRFEFIYDGALLVGGAYYDDSITGSEVLVERDWFDPDGGVIGGEYFYYNPDGSSREPVDGESFSWGLYPGNDPPPVDPPPVDPPPVDPPPVDPPPSGDGGFVAMVVDWSGAVRDTCLAQFLGLLIPGFAILGVYVVSRIIKRSVNSIS